VHAVIDGKAAASSGVAHAEILVAFAEAVVGRDDLALAGARRALLDAVGPEALVDAAAVVGNFQRMVRIADATGIALDAPLDAVSADVRRELDLGRFGAASNTPVAGPLRRAAGRALRTVLSAGLRTAGRISRRRRGIRSGA
jgi:hypothetical protein